MQSWPNRRTLASLCAITACLLVAATIHYARLATLRARLRSINADEIAADADLSRYVKPVGTSAYQRLCASCHGAEPAADGDRAGGKGKGSDWLHGAGRARQIEQLIAQGRAGVCPAWPMRPDAATMRAIAYYLHSMNQAQNRARPP